jgi:hypothetical protein
VLEFTVIHELDCSPERFWETFFDPEFTREMIVGGLGFASCEVDPPKGGGSEPGQRKRTMRVVPKLDLPAAVAKLLGPKLGYTEVGTYDETTEVWTYTMRLSVLSDRIRLGGRLRVEPLGDRCRRVSELWAEAKILGLGGLVERAAEKNMREGWGKSALWMNTWLAEHPVQNAR